MTFTIRPYADEDFSAALSAVSACLRADAEPLNWGEAEFRARVIDPRRAKDELLVAEVEGAGVVAYADGFLRGETYHSRGWVAPDYRGQGIGRALLDRQIEFTRRCAAREDRSIFIGARIPVTAHANIALLQQRGFQLVRYYFDMTRDLGEPIPSRGIAGNLRLLTWAERRADREVHEAFEEAFDDHWGHGRVPFEGFIYWLNTDQWQAANSFIVWDGDQIAGGALNDMGPQAARRWGGNRAWTAVLFVRRPWRKRGLGRALLIASMRQAREMGHAGLKLRVDAENPTGALRLYEAVGFSREFTYVTYHKAAGDENG
jgi:GNAT superfamily N-acetyltransferase